MLTSLDFLNIGESWPPACEAVRLDRYAYNQALFNGEHDIVYGNAFKRIERVIGNFEEVVSYATVLNYQKLVSLKTADLLMSETPLIVAGDSGSKEQVSVDTIVKNSSLYVTGHECAIDVSRMGDGVLHIYKDPDTDNGVIGITQPSVWFPVVDNKNLKRVLYHVLAWTYEKPNADCTEREKFLYVQIHERGRYTEREYSLGNGNVIQEIVSPWPGKVVQTGMDDFAVVQVSNVTTSDSIHGYDDYADIDSIICELMVRVAQVSKILDKHASPSMTGSMAALERDPATGEYRLKLGNYFPRDGKDDPEMKYLTWDGQLESNFKIIDQLVNFLHAISEMGGNILGDKEQEGGVLSGTALRFKMVSPLTKAKRIAMRFAPALEKAINLCSQLGGKNVTSLADTDISITFMDGLPNDPKEEADIMNLRTGGKPTMSVIRALKQYDKMNTDDAEIEMEAIKAEEESANPFLGQTTPFNGNNEPNGGGTNGGSGGTGNNQTNPNEPNGGTPGSTGAQGAE